MSDLLLDMPEHTLTTGELLVRVKSRQDVARPFVAGLIYDTGRDKVTRTAPILRPLMGLSADQLRLDAKQNGWTVTIVKVGE